MIRAVALLLLICSFTAAARADEPVTQWPTAYLTTGEYLKVNQFMRSPNGWFFAVLLPNGRFAIYKGSNPGDQYGVAWNTDHSVADTAYYAQINEDGNFSVWRGASPTANRGLMWHSNVMREKGRPYYLTVQDDGNLCVYKGTPTQPEGLIWSALHAPIPVTWVRDGQFLRNRKLYLYLGYNGQGTDWRLRMGDAQYRQRWGLQPDGTIRWGPESDKCLGLKTPAANQGQLVLETCNGSAIQKGWHYQTADRTLRNKVYPNGCLVMDDLWGSGRMGAEINTECPRVDPRVITEWSREWSFEP